MAIAIPALYDAQLGALQAQMRPKQDGATNIASFAAAPGGLANRMADIMDMLVNLIDAGPLTETAGGSAAQLTDVGAFTVVNSLVGATFTFDAATPTAALQGVVRTVVSNTADVIVFNEALPAVTAIGDFGALEYTSIDADLEAMKQGKGLADSASNPYGPGPNFVNAVIKLNELLDGAALPAYLNQASAEPFGLGSPHPGHGGNHGHGALILCADMLQIFRDAVAGYTAPA